jgi:hypothetical protein
MIVKPDFAPAFAGQRRIHTLQNNSVPKLRQCAVKFISDAALALLTLFAVFSGFLGQQETLEEMGVSLGPNHS